jgi:serine/threonine-protein kinase ULK/ATG1
VGVIIYMMLFGYAPFLPPKGGMINDLIKVIDTQELRFPEGVVASD